MPCVCVSTLFDKPHWLVIRLPMVPGGTPFLMIGSRRLRHHVCCTAHPMLNDQNGLHYRGRMVRIQIFWLMIVFTVNWNACDRIGEALLPGAAAILLGVDSGSNGIRGYTLNSYFNVFVLRSFANIRERIISVGIQFRYHHQLGPRATSFVKTLWCYVTGLILVVSVLCMSCYYLLGMTSFSAKFTWYRPYHAIVCWSADGASGNVDSDGVEAIGTGYLFLWVASLTYVVVCTDLLYIHCMPTERKWCFVHFAQKQLYICTC